VFEIRVPLVESTFSPLFERRADVERRLTAAAVEAIRQQLDAAEVTTRSAGYLPTPTKTTGREHFLWLVRYHVMNETYSEIARSVYLSRQNVMSAIQGTSQLIELPLREADPRGQPPTKNRPVIVKF
jgi:hypothetical protein